MTPCPACHHPERTLIDAHIASGDINEVVAKMYDLDEADVEAHRGHPAASLHRPPTAPVASPPPKGCTCSIGPRPNAAAIDADLLAKIPVRKVAAKYALGKSTVARHRRACLGLEGDDAPTTADPPPGTTLGHVPPQPGTAEFTSDPRSVAPAPPVAAAADPSVSPGQPGTALGHGAVEPDPVAAEHPEAPEGVVEDCDVGQPASPSPARIESHGISSKTPTSSDTDPTPSGVPKVPSGTPPGTAVGQPPRVSGRRAWARVTESGSTWSPDPDSPYPDLPGNRTDRVTAIMKMMNDNAWEPTTGPLLAAYWGFSPLTVKQWADEASRNIERDVDPTNGKRFVSGALRRGVETAEATGDLKAIASLGTVYANVLRITDNGTKVNVNVLTDPAVTGMLRVQRVILDALFPGVNDVLAEGLKAWTAGGSGALKQFVEAQQARLMLLEAGDAEAITVEAEQAPEG